MLPLEPITALVGLGMGIYTKIKLQQIESLREERISRQPLIDDTQHAREIAAKNPGIQWTKRVLALMVTGTWCALHLGINFADLLHVSSHVTIGYTELVPKFLFFGEKEAFKWVSVDAPAITPAFNNVVILMMTYYFGSGGTIKKY